jgi:leucyl-tRNA synthetase
VANLYELTSAIEKAKPSTSRSEAVRTLLKLVAPMVPHLAEEAWSALGESTMLVDVPWPEHDPALLVDEQVTVAIQVNGKLRDTLTVPRGSPKEELERQALAAEKIARILGDSAPRKLIVVPDRLVNIVL